MPCHALSIRSIILSWAVALVVWPVVWALAPIAQGLATAAAGGGWIGITIPLGATPWALVNEPTIAFAASRTALVAYWLPPLLAPLLLALLTPLLAPTSGRWCGELVAFHVALSSAVLGLAWAPALGRADGAVAGLARFASAPAGLVVGAAALASCGGAALAFRRLGGRLWAARGGPTRLRRVGLVLAHGLVPGAGWIGAATLLGWPLPAAGVITVGAVLTVAVVAALAIEPRMALRADLTIGVAPIVTAALLGSLLLAAALCAGAARTGRPLALLWGEPSATNNIRPALLRYRLTLPRVVTTPPVP